MTSEHVQGSVQSFCTFSLHIVWRELRCESRGADGSTYEILLNVAATSKPAAGPKTKQMFYENKIDNNK